MAFSYVLTLFMFLGGLFGSGNDLLDYIPAEAYWKLKTMPMTYANMADEARSADPAAAVNLAKVFETSSGEDRDRLALALIDQGESARLELDRLSRLADADLAARAKACLAAIDQAPKARAVRRLMAIRTLGGLGKKDAIPLLQPLLNSKEPFVAAYATEAIASLDGKPAPLRSFPPALKGDIWRLPGECRAVAQIAPKVAGPELADRVLSAMNLPAGMDRAEAIDGLTFTLVQIADRFGDMRFDGMTLGASGDLGGNAGYLIAITRGYYDHAAINRALSDAKTPFNDFAGGRIHVPGDMAIYAPSDDLLIFAASPTGTPPVQAVITTAGGTAATTRPVVKGASHLPATNPAPNATGANVRLDGAGDMVKLIETIDATQPVWLALKSGEAWRSIQGLAGLETLTLTGRPSRAGTMELHLEAKLAGAAAAKDAAAAMTALLAQQPPQGGAAQRPAPSSPLLGTLSAALGGTAVSTDGSRMSAVATFTLARADIMRLLLTSMDRPRKPG